MTLEPQRPARRAPRRGRRAVGVLVPFAALALSSCEAQTPSALRAQGPAAHSIAGLWWFMFVVSAVVIVFVAALILLGVRARGKAAPDERETPTWARRLLIGGGVVFPVVILSVLWVLTVHEMQALSEPARPATIEIDVTGRQWWWAVSYPTQRIVDANDIHIPAGRPVRLVLTTADVNHSFWVPELTAKMDMIAGRPNTIWLEADHPGVYRGQCAEYCGLQHANMAFYVVAMAPRDFDAWLARERQPPAAPTDPAAQRGAQVFEAQACAGCHTIAGTTANGKVGPDLTHFGGRLTIGAGTLNNTAGNLGGWIADAQDVKPGNIMPPIQVPPADLQALIRYLESLK